MLDVKTKCELVTNITIIKHISANRTANKKLCCDMETAIYTSYKNGFYEDCHFKIEYLKNTTNPMIDYLENKLLYKYNNKILYEYTRECAFLITHNNKNNKNNIFIIQFKNNNSLLEFISIKDKINYIKKTFNTPEFTDLKSKIIDEREYLDQYETDFNGIRQTKELFIHNYYTINENKLKFSLTLETNKNISYEWDLDKL